MKIIKKKAKNTFNVSGGITPKYGFSLDYGRKTNKNKNEKFELNLKDKILKKNEN